MYRFIGFLVLLLFFSFGNSQEANLSFFEPADTLNTSRRNLVVISEASLMTGGLIALNELWYNDFERSKFQTIDDLNEWYQLDKMGHVLSSYQLSRIVASTYKWAGVGDKNSNLYGGLTSFSFLTAIEIMDGYSQEWGFSWSDMAANTLGTGLYLSQELLWEEQRVHLKFSFNRSKYAALNPDKLGQGLLEEVFKDYNGQTYWLSVNLHSFFKESNIPKWLNVALGFGADGMLNATNESQLENFGISNRFRQYYLSLDLDLTRLQTKSAFLRSVFSLINVLKIPFPSLEFNTSKGGTLRMQWY